MGRIGAHAIAVLVCLFLMPVCLPPAEAAGAGAADAGTAKSAGAPVDAASLIEFVDAGAGESRRQNKGWSAADSQLLERLVSQLNKEVPGLLKRAASGDRIRLYRVARLGVTTDLAGSYSNGAQVAGDGIWISDAFFLQGNAWQFRTLLHELTHLADTAGQIAYSRDWVQFAEPKICDCRCIALIEQIAGRSSDDAAKSNEWPSVWGCENLPESLAEYMTAAIVGRQPFKGNQAFLSRFGSRLFSTKKGELEFLAHYQKGQRLLEKKDFANAISEFRACADIDPRSPMVFGCLASAYLSSRNFEAALQSANTAIKLCDEAAVPENEPGRTFCQKSRAWALIYLGRESEALRALNWAIALGSSRTDYREMLELRSYCHELQQDYASAANDLLLAHRNDPVLNIAPACAGRARVMEYLAKLIQSPARSRALQVRAALLEAAAARQPTGTEQRNLYQQAIADLRSATPSTTTEKVYNLLTIANIDRKLGLESETRNVYEQAAKVDPKDIAVKVFKLGLLQSDRSRSSASELHDAFTAIKGELRSQAAISQQASGDD